MYKRDVATLKGTKLFEKKHRKIKFWVQTIAIWMTAMVRYKNDSIVFAVKNEKFITLSKNVSLTTFL